MTGNYFLSNISSGVNATSLSFSSSDSSVEKVLKTLAYGVIVLFSVIGNSLVIAAFKLNTNGKLRTVNNMFIVSMAAGDLLMTLGSTPERITRVLTSDQWLIQGGVGIFFCKTTNYIEKLCMNVSLLHIAMIAIDRFLVVFYPRRKVITGQKALRIIIIAWLASAGYCAPLFYYANLLEKDGKLLCKTRAFFDNWRVWYLLFLSLFVIILLLVVGLYTAIVVQLCRSKTPGTRLSFKTQHCARLNNRLLKMVAIILFAFYSCFLPYWLGWIFCSYHRTNRICNDTYVFISILVLYANSAINPVIYSFFNEHFQVGFRSIYNNLRLCCRCAMKNQGLLGENLASNTLNTKGLVKIKKQHSEDRQHGEDRCRLTIKTFTSGKQSATQV